MRKIDLKLACKKVIKNLTKNGKDSKIILIINLRAYFLLLRRVGPGKYEKFEMGEEKNVQDFYVGG